MPVLLHRSEVPDPQLLVDRGDEPLHLRSPRNRNLHVERAGQMQRLDLAHPGEGDLVVGPLSLGDNREFVFAGAFKRPVVAGSDILDHRERMVFRIDSAFEQGHAVSTSCLFVVSDTHALGPARASLTSLRRSPRSRCSDPGISAGLSRIN
ncbi:hypothetical protein ACVWWR_001905 [Bradyrhizobium sp. LM3.2]